MSNVALVVLDTLRKEWFDEHFDWLPGIRFENAWSPSGWTVPAHASLFTGRYPSEVGVVAKSEELDCNRPVLAEELSNERYTTRAFSANAFVSRAYGYDRGFDEFESNWRGDRADENVVDWSEFIAQSDDGPTRYLSALHQCFKPENDTVRSLKHGLKIKAGNLGIDWLFGDPSGAREALHFVRTTDFGDDEFLFVNLMEAHSPYAPPREYRTVTLDENPSLSATMSDSGPDEAPDTVKQAYTDAVRYLSDAYRDVFDELVADFDVVITLGDHGECFGEYGIWAHNHGIPPELVNVPLTIYRGESEDTTVDSVVNLLDVHRTILELIGIEDSDSRGQHLLGEPESRPTFTERFGLRSLEIEKRRGEFSDETIEAYDTPQYGVVLPDDYYGWETNEGFEEVGDSDISDPVEHVRSMREELEHTEFDETDLDDVDEAVKQRLEDLGYA